MTRFFCMPRLKRLFLLPELSQLAHCYKFRHFSRTIIPRGPKKSVETRESRNFQRFNDYFATLYDSNWDTLLKALRSPVQQCALVNKFGHPDTIKTLTSRDAACVNYEDLWLDDPFYKGSKDSLHDNLQNDSITKECKDSTANKLTIFIPPRDEAFDSPFNGPKQGELLSYYLLDLSSLVPVMALSLTPSSYVLDICGAPGGKSLAILQLIGKDGHLVTNDLSHKRKRRIMKVLNEYIPTTVQHQTTVLNLDGRDFGGNNPNTFDSVLVDAPCSAERHVIQDGFFAAGWSLKKCNQYADLQHELLMSAIYSARAGGSVVYSTCSICDIENEKVIERSLDRCSEERISIKPINCLHMLDSIGPQSLHVKPCTNYGAMILPCENSNWGPLYMCKLMKM